MSQIRSGSGREQENLVSDDCYVRLDAGYEKLCFNAQSGELLNSKCWNAQDAATFYLQKILAWEDLQ